MLATDAHGSVGGISQFNRDAIDAFCAIPQLEEIVVLPRGIAEPSVILPPKVRYDLLAARGPLAFVRRTLAQAIFGGPFDLVHCAHINLMPVAIAAARAAHAPLVLTVHGTDAWFRPRRRIAVASVKSADLIIAVSQLTADRMRKWLPGVKPSIVVVPNAVRLERFGPGKKNRTLIARYGLEGRRVIMTLGRMAADERAKGFDQVIELMPRLLRQAPDLVYLCAGEGDDRSRLEAKAHGLGLRGAVVFTGRLSEESKADHLRLADTFVMASRWEGFGIVVIEALACGVPVIGSTADGTQEALLGGKLGPSVNPDDPDALEEAILAGLARPKGVPEALSYFTFERFEARFHAALTSVMPAMRDPPVAKRLDAQAV